MGRNSSELILLAFGYGKHWPAMGFELCIPAQPCTQKEWLKSTCPKAAHKTLMKSTPGVHFGVHFANIIRAAFTCADPKSAIKLLNLTVFFALSGSAGIKAAQRTLVKLTPEEMWLRTRFEVRKTRNKNLWSDSKWVLDRKTNERSKNAIAIEGSRDEFFLSKPFKRSQMCAKWELYSFVLNARCRCRFQYAVTAFIFSKVIQHRRHLSNDQYFTHE